MLELGARRSIKCLLSSSMTATKKTKREARGRVTPDVSVKVFEYGHFYLHRTGMHH